MKARVTVNSYGEFGVNGTRARQSAGRAEHGVGVSPGRTQGTAHSCTAEGGYCESNHEATIESRVKSQESREREVNRRVD